MLLLLLVAERLDFLAQFGPLRGLVQPDGEHAGCDSDNDGFM
jgi:hypothetical protein